MKIRILEGDIHLQNLRTRMPFKYGIATMTRMPMVFVRLIVEVNGDVLTGISSDLLPPKWFTKEPDKAVNDEILEMLRVIRQALKLAVGLDGENAFAVWRQLYQRQMEWGNAQGIPPLLVHFGTSLMERAMIEAVCQRMRRPFQAALRDGTLGCEPGEVHPTLQGRLVSEWLPLNPLAKVTARHTVGLADPLTDDEIPSAERLADGLPQSLTAAIGAYGLRHFKLKVNGELERDLDRLGRIAAILQAQCGRNFRFTLDGNEQFKSMAQFRAFWEELSRRAGLAEFLEQLLFVEQPLHRAVAIEPGIAKELTGWPGRPPLIIDESDATLDSLPQALELGYDGTSHKNCKGVFKGVINRCLLTRSALGRGRPVIMSGEDLCNVGPVALLQDLAVMSALGIGSVERNGHHYNAGLSQFPPEIQEQVLQHHGDLYQRTPAGWPTLTIEQGEIALGSVNRAPFGVGFTVDVRQFTRETRWDVNTL